MERAAQRVGIFMAMFALTHLIASPTTRAQTSDAPTRSYKLTGISLGVYSVAAPGISITGDDIDGTFKTKFGGGAGLMIGVGLSSRLSTFVALDVAKQQSNAPDYEGSFGLGHVEAGARLNLAGAGSRTVPYVSGSFGRRAVGAKVRDIPMERDVDLTMYGNAIGVGGGIEHFISAHTTLDIGAEYGFGKFDHYEDQDQKAPLDVNKSKSVRMRVGFTWHP
jgi:hypothetical protein